MVRIHASISPGYPDLRDELKYRTVYRYQFHRREHRDDPTVQNFAISPGKPAARRANAQLVVEPVEEALGPQAERFRLDVQVGALRRGEGDEGLRAGQGVVELPRLAGPELLALRIGDQQRAADLVDHAAQVVGACQE